MGRARLFDVTFTIQDELRIVERGHLVLHAPDEEAAKAKARQAIFAGLCRMHLKLDTITVGIHSANVVA